MRVSAPKFCIKKVENCANEKIFKSLDQNKGGASTLYKNYAAWNSEVGGLRPWRGSISGLLLTTFALSHYRPEWEEMTHKWSW